MINTPYQFKSLASRVRSMHGALDADELAKLLGVAKVTILRRAKRGKIPSFRIGTLRLACGWRQAGGWAKS